MFHDMSLLRGLSVLELLQERGFSGSKLRLAGGATMLAIAASRLRAR